MAKGCDFWCSLDELVSTSELIVDRPKGSCHPRYPDVCYPLDYGYLQGTQAGDGGGVDVWVGSLAEWALMGIVCTVDLVKRDAEVKLLLGCTPQEIETVLAFHGGGLQSAIWVARHTSLPESGSDV